ncbi:predicted protein [Aspergillus nidulans FGSC A4]|uniref:Uncharacterized protein n=1 Tax=Emericella nidulans (strain FGSC A4 / ATCC 38163 / CBS 112.46 / NRRL 194 / M139) TaxID=227321 RepID=Q5B2I9_EMENI|nr:hypothetical protein [Aspergillus nidulans FGSC A4]EAA62422.1 predicted protein [Aspergillus nidulans FGSC A4]CBF81151.1 TPA: conserved hypothetical protein [Aspergillus nidulans FGSC A4]|eukprot:XP_662845.1 predicted protein [Aspergillus nidulans FGSC A4]
MTENPYLHPGFAGFKPRPSHQRLALCVFLGALLHTAAVNSFNGFDLWEQKTTAICSSSLLLYRTPPVTCLALTPYPKQRALLLPISNGVKSSPPNINERSFSSSPRFRHKAFDTPADERQVPAWVISMTEVEVTASNEVKTRSRSYTIKGTPIVALTREVGDVGDSDAYISSFTYHLYTHPDDHDARFEDRLVTGIAVKMVTYRACYSDDEHDFFGDYLDWDQVHLWSPPYEPFLLLSIIYTDAFWLVRCEACGNQERASSSLKADAGPAQVSRQILPETTRSMGRLA